MKLVIDISDKDYNNIEPFLNGKTINGGFNLFKVLEIIRNGTPLPEHHGRIIDGNVLKNNIHYVPLAPILQGDYVTYRNVIFADILDMLPAIIEGSDSECMAIKALEQEQSEDCISRQVVKDMLTAEWTKYMPMELDMNLSFVLDKISALPSVAPKTEWIPVNERLPEDVGGEYLVNIEYKGEHEGIDIAEYQIGGYMDGLWITPNDWIEGPHELWHVTAWMPLPEPYKKEV